LVVRRRSAGLPKRYGDLSANSGLNALLRDEDYAREFLARYQDKLMFGSDCDDRVGEGAACSGARCVAAIRRLAPNNKIAEKILHANAARVLKIRAV